jgi:hypothetical protein
MKKMSKQSEAKQKQGYDKKPKSRVCSNCRHYMSDFITQKNLYGDYEEEKNKRCGLGGFAVKKTATCNEFKKVDDAK